MVNSLGAILKRERDRLDLSQEALAKLLEVTQQAVQSWEQDKSRPKRDRVEKMIEVFGENSEFAHVMAVVRPWISDWSPSIDFVVTGIKVPAAASPPAGLDPPPRAGGGLPAAVQIEKSFFDALPPTLRGNTERLGVGQVDYISEKVVAELVLAINAPRLFDRVAPPLLRLAVYRGGVENRPAIPGRRCILFLVSPEGRTPLIAVGYQRVMSDALTLGVEVAIVSGGVEAAAIITEIEQGRAAVQEPS